ncbi:Gfo/Idh/MocA family protein [Blastopirellula retiformator]|uniref:1,5-anhydro-D-fructose reductase n=1 Tax=Blastopirellula retiformator TaxID=2527970 RepID=A0A5C5UVS4_9BACT|nr:Gfo/Idh/MocA family oxidoreductase [Blastopirellula retiformator]TWT29495.1 1,5-anhydro-D-fructose reductase [Blastopirellula retiformator]
MRWGILGCGDVVRKRVAAAIQAVDGCQLLAVCRRDPDALQQFCAGFSVPHGYPSADQLLANADIDAVYIATPVALHLPQTLAALAAGKHVLVEKPMALDPQECRLMIDAAKEVKRTLGVAYYRPFYPALARLAELIKSGQLGEILAVQIACSAPIVPNEDGSLPWRVAMNEGGGGPIMDVGSHRIDVLLRLFGDVVDVREVCSRKSTHEVENVANFVLQFAGGLQASVTCLFDAGQDPDSFVVIGTKGIADLGPLNSGRLIIRNEMGDQVEHHAPNANFNVPLIADFVAAVSEGRDPRASGETGLRVNEVIDQIYRDAQQAN